MYNQNLTWVNIHMQNTDSQNKSLFLVGWLMCILAALFYCYAYILRVFPSVMTDELSDLFSLNATSLGLLTTFYYAAYTPMQLGVGIIIDRYGARIILSIACLIATLGLFVFSTSSNLQFVELGRFMMGFGSAFAYVTALKLASLWLPPNRFACMAGLTTSFGKAAAISSTFILTKSVQTIGITQSLNSLLILGIILSIMIVLFIRNRPKASTNKKPEQKLSFKQVFHQLKCMLKNPQMWLIGAIGLVLYLPACIFLDIWGIPYLKAVYNLTPAQANISISMIFIGWLISSPIIGSISDRIKSRKKPLIICSFIATILICLAFYTPGLSILDLNILLFSFGVCCGSHPLCFALSKENNPTNVAGSATALTNTMIMIGGYLQPVVGLMLDYHWQGKIIANHKLYTSSDYQFALSILPIALLLSTALCTMLKETRCQNVHDKQEDIIRKPELAYE